jgi:hypothetical protein
MKQPTDAELIAAVDAEYRAALARQIENSREVARLRRKKARLLDRLARQSPIDMLRIERTK